MTFAERKVNENRSCDESCSSRAVFSIAQTVILQPGGRPLQFETSPTQDPMCLVFHDNPHFFPTLEELRAVAFVTALDGEGKVA